MKAGLDFPLVFYHALDGHDCPRSFLLHNEPCLRLSLQRRTSTLGLISLSLGASNAAERLGHAASSPGWASCLMLPRAGPVKPLEAEPQRNG